MGGQKGTRLNKHKATKRAMLEVLKLASLTKHYFRGRENRSLNYMYVILLQSLCHL